LFPVQQFPFVFLHFGHFFAIQFSNEILGKNTVFSLKKSQRFKYPMRIEFIAGGHTSRTSHHWGVVILAIGHSDDHAEEEDFRKWGG
jgi:hypothetical protein